MILFFLCMVFTAPAQTPEHMFSHANAAYQKNEFAFALTEYEQIPDKGPAVWYNMGNCAFKLHDEIKAFLYWQRAYKTADTDLKKNITANMARLTITRAPLSPLPSPRLMQILFFCIFGIFLIVGYFLIRARAWIFLALSVAVLVSAARITYHVAYISRAAVVMSDNTPLRAGPGHEYHQLGTVGAGMMVTVLQQKHGWSQIIQDGTKGWIKNIQIEEI